jgi:hypothetical protein
MRSVCDRPGFGSFESPTPGSQARSRGSGGLKNGVARRKRLPAGLGRAEVPMVLAADGSYARVLRLGQG